MHQSFTKRAYRLRGLAILALMMISLPGCAWLKREFAAKPVKVPSDPERREIVDSKTRPVKTAGAKSAGGMLDGSATGNDAPATPNAPGLASTQIPASGLAPDDPSAGLPSSFDN
ncbi:MAG TPA: hypothetical protein VGH74_18735, partial [Planctomycetaceae bacterium]